MGGRRDRELDLIVWGATGFTGRLVAEYLQQHYGATDLRWALGGRNEAKLAAVRDRIGASGVPLVLGDAHDQDDMKSLARRAAVICTTVGPYARYGEPLVAACAAQGTDYCDLAGEITWIRRMQDVYAQKAAETGARIVNACGFDSIPPDLGVYFLQREMRRRHGMPSPAVDGLVWSISAGLSGGTVASMLAVFEAPQGEGPMSRVTGEPYLLNPAGARDGPAVRDQLAPHYDADFDVWTAPFPGATINTRIVRRSAAQLKDVYGQRMRYRESMSTGSGPLGALKAAGTTLGLGAALAAMSIGPVRRFVASRLPEPGEGPSEEARRRGHWEMRFFGVAPDAPGATPLWIRVHDDRDPGYGSSSKMIAESAVCLALDARNATGGLHTPATAMGSALLERLQRNAEIGFEVIPGPAGRAVMG